MQTQQTKGKLKSTVWVTPLSAKKSSLKRKKTLERLQSSIQAASTSYFARNLIRNQNLKTRSSTQAFKLGKIN